MLCKNNLQNPKCLISFGAKIKSMKKIELTGLRAIKENPETGFVQYENEFKESWWMPEVFFKAWKDLDNMRRSRDYFKQERNDLKKLHEELLSSAHNRISQVERAHEIIEGNVNNLLNETTFLRSELDIAERDLNFFKTSLIAVSFVAIALFVMICYKAL